MSNSLSARVGRLLAGALRPVPASPTLGGVLDAMANVEAAEFVERDEVLAFERFALLAASLDSAIARDREGLAAIEAIEACPRGNGREHGLEWAYEQLFLDADRLRQVRDLLRQLAPHEALIRSVLQNTHARARGAARDLTQ